MHVLDVPAPTHLIHMSASLLGFYGVLWLASSIQICFILKSADAGLFRPVYVSVMRLMRQLVKVCPKVFTNEWVNHMVHYVWTPMQGKGGRERDSDFEHSQVGKWALLGCVLINCITLKKFLQGEFFSVDCTALMAWWVTLVWRTNNRTLLRLQQLQRYKWIIMPPEELWCRALDISCHAKWNISCFLRTRLSRICESCDWPTGQSWSFETMTGFSPSLFFALSLWVCVWVNVCVYTHNTVYVCSFCKLDMANRLPTSANLPAHLFLIPGLSAPPGSFFHSWPDCFTTLSGLFFPPVFSSFTFVATVCSCLSNELALLSYLCLILVFSITLLCYKNKKPTKGQDNYHGNRIKKLVMQNAYNFCYLSYRAPQTLHINHPTCTESETCKIAPCFFFPFHTCSVVTIQKSIFTHFIFIKVY